MKSVYKIPLPNGSKECIEYENNYDFKKRIEIVKNILNKNFEGMTLEEYLNEYWIWLNAFNPYKINYEDKTKATLERLTNFILNYNEAGEGKRNRKKDYKSLRNMNYIYKKELPIGLIVGDENENIDEKTINEKDLYNKDKDSYDLSCKDLDRRKKRKRKTIKNTTFYKIDKIISKKDKIIPYVDSITNEEYYKFLGLNPKKYIPLKEFEGKRNQEKDKETIFENWLNKSKRNLYNQPIFTIRKKKIKGHKGVINSEKPYDKEWCYVNTDNIFTYKNIKYKIDKNVKSYKVKKDNQCEMDSILVFEQDGNKYFYDMNIKRIKNDLIKTLNN